MKNLRDAAGGNHFVLEVSDLVRPCPFCGNDEICTDPHDESGGLELKNTHTASYWIECPCGVEVSGESHEGGGRIARTSEAKHRKAAKSALDHWNERTHEHGT